MKIQNVAQNLKNIVANDNAVFIRKVYVKQTNKYSWPCRTMNNTPIHERAVSYTHLDVYKRQVLISAATTNLNFY